MVFFFFKPLNIKEQKFDDVPLFELKSFVMYELNTHGLDTYMTGTQAVRFTDRYEVTDMDYTDNSKQYIANMKSDFGLYKGRMVDLDGDVVYTREDGLTFESQHIIYDKKTTIATSDNDYVAYQNDNSVRGTYMQYNNTKNTIDSKNIIAIYKLGEK